MTTQRRPDEGCKENEMQQNAWIERLNHFKENERPEAVLLVAGSSPLTRIAIAWTNTRVARARRLSRCSGTSDDEIWKWLWENTRYSREELLARIPSSDSNTERSVDTLIANRVLHPDGTLNSFVERYLREKVLRIFGVKKAIPSALRRK